MEGAGAGLAVEAHVDAADEAPQDLGDDGEVVEAEPEVMVLFRVAQEGVVCGRDAEAGDGAGEEDVEDELVGQQGVGEVGAKVGEDGGVADEGAGAGDEVGVDVDRLVVQGAEAGEAEADRGGQGPVAGEDVLVGRVPGRDLGAEAEAGRRGRAVAKAGPGVESGSGAEAGLFLLGRVPLERSGGDGLALRLDLLLCLELGLELGVAVVGGGIGDARGIIAKVRGRRAA